MAKAGRKRRQGVERDAKGRIKRPTNPEREYTVRETVMLARARHRGITQTVDNLRLMNDPRLGFPLGQFAYDKRITEDQFQAGLSFAITYNDFARITGLPSATPRACTYGERIVGLDNAEPNPDRVRKLREAWWQADSALQVAGSGPAQAVFRCCVEDAPARVEWLRLGLNELAGHFRRLGVV